MTEEPVQLWQAIFQVPANSSARLEDLLLGDRNQPALSISIFRTQDTAIERLSVLYSIRPDTEYLNSVIEQQGYSRLESVTPLVNRDWVTESQKGRPPLHVGRFYVTESDRALAPPASAIPIVIDAAQAFGTGQHGTTAGCLWALSDLAKTGCPRSVLDLGTGSGVLAIATAKLWRQPVLASDLDPTAVTIAKANAALNEVGPWIQTLRAHGCANPAIRTRTFDLICANILAGPLIGLAPEIARLLAPKGTVILSGILTTQMPRVLSFYRAQRLALCSRIVRDEWCTLILKAP